MMTRAQKLKSFMDDAEAVGLKDETVKKLTDIDVDTKDTVQLLQENHIKDLQLSLGQELVLRKWVRKLNSKPCDPPTAVASGSLQQTTSAIDPALDSLLQQMEGETPAEGPEPNIDYKSMGKPLYIIDHITNPHLSSVDQMESAVCTQGGAQLVLRASRQKPLPDQVSLAQWVGANARIMQKLVRSHQLQSTEALCAYLEHTIRVSDYAQVNSLPSVMVYDHEYRRKQAEKNRSWEEDDFHLANFFLRRKEQNSRTDYNQRRRSDKRPSEHRSVELCWNYNNRGCLRDHCKYAHLCSICNTPGHSKMTHKDSARLNPTAPPFNSQQPH